MARKKKSKFVEVQQAIIEYFRSTQFWVDTTLALIGIVILASFTALLVSSKVKEVSQRLDKMEAAVVFHDQFLYKVNEQLGIVETTQPIEE